MVGIIALLIIVAMWLFIAILGRGEALPQDRQRPTIRIANPLYGVKPAPKHNKKWL